MSFFEELKRRNVFRVGIAYLITAWLLVQVADILLETFDAPEWAMQFIVVLLVIGFPLALFFAWAFELTPEGVKKEKDVDRSQSMTPRTGKKLDRAIIFGLVAVIVIMGVERFWFAGRGAGPEVPGSDEQISVSEDQITAPNAHSVDRQSVAVLPFTAMSSGEDDGYFADGLTEEILNSLTRLPELLVTARTSSFHFKGRDLPIPEIARTLGVDNVVEGSVRRSGERVRITAQLIRAADGFHLWSDTYDHTLEDVFAVQEDIAGNIAATLDVVLDENKRNLMRNAGIGDVAAFIAYQKGWEAMGVAHTTDNPAQGLPEANRLFDQALAIVPGIANAYFMRTDLYGHIIYNHAANIAPADPEALESASEEILASLAMAAKYSHSEGQRAIIEAERMEFSGDWSGIPARLDRAFSSSECFPVNWVASLAGPFGWGDQMMDHWHRMIRCDPLNGLMVTMFAQFALWAGELDTAIEESDRFLELHDFNPWIDDIRFLALLATGGYRDDPRAMDPNPEGSYLAFPRRVLVHAMNNEIEIAREVFEEHLNLSEIDELSLLMVKAALGNRVEANAIAGRLDARFAGPFILAEAVKGCFCGAPFDLEATPNFKARIEEAGFAWPPPTPIRYPAKDW